MNISKVTQKLKSAKTDTMWEHKNKPRREVASFIKLHTGHGCLAAHLKKRNTLYSEEYKLQRKNKDEKQ